MYSSVCVSRCVSFFSAGWQVDKGEDVVLYEAGETQEYRVQEETHEAQTAVQCPLIEVYSQNLDRQKTKGLQLSSCSGLSHMWHYKTLTVRNTDASRSPTEKIRPLLLSLIWKRTWSQPININNNLKNHQEGKSEAKALYTKLLSALLIG